LRLPSKVYYDDHAFYTKHKHICLYHYHKYHNLIKALYTRAISLDSRLKSLIIQGLYMVDYFGYDIRDVERLCKHLIYFYENLKDCKIDRISLT